MSIALIEVAGEGKVDNDNMCFINTYIGIPLALLQPALLYQLKCLATRVEVALPSSYHLPQSLEEFRINKQTFIVRNRDFTIFSKCLFCNDILY